MFEQVNFLMWWRKEVPSDNELKTKERIEFKRLKEITLLRN